MQFIKEYQIVVSVVLSTITLAGMLVGAALGLWRKIRAEFLKGVLRLQIWNDGLPLVERVEAGHVYLKNGWNGPTSVKIEENLEKFKKEMHRGEGERK